ncbi:uncharacterized protein Dwil_GK23650 [Drosophila willistoni]|uniref:Uncharacterized protein n=1 Tax=Drosophila willistoni TaxID=7260 RepID=A0A0Q9WSN3_DROWI|nr:uncharacterized protein Dwil_GK23650 [Drosophila willistoni]
MATEARVTPASSEQYSAKRSKISPTTKAKTTVHEIGMIAEEIEMEVDVIEEQKENECRHQPRPHQQKTQQKNHQHSQKSTRLQTAQYQQGQQQLHQQSQSSQIGSQQQAMQHQQLHPTDVQQPRAQQNAQSSQEWVKVGPSRSSRKSYVKTSGKLQKSRPEALLIQANEGLSYSQVLERDEAH